jgi:WD40 repeat protein
MSRTPLLSVVLAMATAVPIATGQPPASLAPSATATLTAEVTSLTSMNISTTGSAAATPRVAAGLADGRVAIWDGRDKSAIVLKAHDSRVVAVGSTTDGLSVLSLAADGSLARTTVTPGSESTSRQLEVGMAPTRAGAFSADGSVVVTGGEFGDIRLFDTSSGALKQHLRGHRTELQALALRPGSSVLASASAESDLRLWNTDTGRQIGEIDGDVSLFALAFSPTDGTLAAGGVNRRLSLRDPATFKSDREVTFKAPRMVGTVAWSPDGRLIAIGDVDDETLSKGGIQLFASSTGAPGASLDTGGIPAAALTFAGDATIVGIIGRDLRAWTVTRR